MNDQINTHSAVEMNTAANEEGTVSAELRKRVRSIARDLLLGFTREMLDKADDALFDLANKADSNTSQQLYFDAMRDIRIKRGSIENGYKASIDDAFQEFEKGKVLQHETLKYTEIASKGNLELIGDEEMELSIAVFNMAEKQERNCYQALYEVTARVGLLYQHGNLQLQQHPLSPVAVATAFGEAIHSLDIEFKIKLIIYKLFDKYVMPGLGAIYQELNTMLVRAGILPKVFHTIKRTENFHRKSGARHTVGESTHGYGSGYSQYADDGWETVPTQDAQYDFGIPGFAPAGSQSSESMGALSSLQAHIRKHGYPEHLRPMDIGENLIKGFRELGYQSVTGSVHSDRNIISTVSMIFDYILDDGNIPNSIKSMLSRLQVPFLKLALLEKDFLKQKDHPARVLLNEMARASIGWTSGKDKGDLPQKLSAIVNYILENFEKDVKLFVKLQDDFDGYLKEDAERNRIFEERTRKTMEGKERIQYAKNRIDAWIHVWSNREGTPTLITTFLRHIWKSVMLYLMHRFGEDSKEWKYHIKLINALIWSVQPGKNEQEVVKLIRILPNILRGLHRGMLLVSTHNKSVQAFFEGLADCHAQIMREGFTSGEPAQALTDISDDSDIAKEGDVDQMVKTVYDGMPVEEEDVSSVMLDPDLENIVEEVVLESPEPPVCDQDDEIKDDYDKTAHEMQCGTWVELDHNGEEGVRAKLAWRSELTGKCLFVGRNGVKVAERTVGELADDLRCGHCRQLNEQPLLERAMDAVKNTLKTEQGEPGENTVTV